MFSEFVTLGLGPVILPVPRGTKVPGLWEGDQIVNLSGWQKMSPTGAEVESWERDGRYNVGLRCGIPVSGDLRFYFIDVDVDDEAEAAKLKRLFIDMGLKAIRTRDNSPRFGMPFLSDKRFGRIVHSGPFGKVEVLGEGRQVVIAGTHPTGAKITFSGDSLPVLDNPFFALEGYDYQTRFRDGEICRRDRVVTADPVARTLLQRGHVMDNKGRVDIDCPFSENHSTKKKPFDTVYLPSDNAEGISRGHFRCLHASCESRTNEEFLHKLNLVDDDFEPESVAIEYERNNKGEIITSSLNLMLAIGTPSEIGFDLAYDDATAMLIYRKVGGSEWSEVNENFYTDVNVALDKIGIRVLNNRNSIRHAVKRACAYNVIDSLKTYADSIPEWDGKRRIGRAFKFMSQSDRNMFVYWLKGVWERINKPGSPAHKMLVLIGNQGSGKTRLLRSLFGEDRYAEVSFARVIRPLELRGKIVVNFDEMSGINRKTNNNFKAWLTRNHDDFRPLYTDDTVRIARRFAVAGTADESQILPESGRRYLTVKVDGPINFDYILENRDQILAETYDLWKNEHFDAHEMTEEAAESSKKHEEQFPYAAQVDEWLETPNYDAPYNGRKPIDGFCRISDCRDYLRKMKLSNMSDWELGREIGKYFRTGHGMVSSVVRISGITKTQCAFYKEAAK